MSTSSKWPAQVTFEYPSVIGKCGVAARKMEDDVAREARVREQAQREVETRLHESLERSLNVERQQIRAAVEGFTAECDQYHQRVESEVVQLALAIARRVLHREAQADPLMLAGVVRVAIDNLRAATQIKLHVAPGHTRAWREMFAESAASYSVEVIEEPLFAPSQVRLETDLGTTDLGVEDQLKEIEQGFLDLLTARPR